MPTFLNKKKKFPGVQVVATYYLSAGKVWLKEAWSTPGKTWEYHEPEPWDSTDVVAVAKGHDWGLYIEPGILY